MRKTSLCILAVVAGAFLVAGTGCSDTKIIAQRDGLAAQNKELDTQLKAERDARAAAEARASAHDATLTAAPADALPVPEMGPLDLSKGPRTSGIFYDRKGRDWDATITRILDNPISIRQAFWAPYKK